MKVVVFDPALENVNAGDEIISRSISNLGLNGITGATRLTTHRLLGLAERREVSRADLVVLGGSNAISSHMERFRQWLIDPDMARRMRGKLVLLGVGWWQYQEEPCWYTRRLYDQILSSVVPHAVRDAYTAKRLNALGHESLMTSCPTMWGLRREQTAPGKTSSVVVTVTDYKRDVPVDQRWLDAVYSRYDDVRLVGMGPGDEDYMLSGLNLPRQDWAGSGVDALDRALVDADFIGTRLHAGVRALQMGGSALVLAVDNRATEISSTTRLSVVERGDVEAIQQWTEQSSLPDLELPTGVIEKWSSAFQAYAG